MEDIKLDYIQLCKIKSEIDNSLYDAITSGQAKYIADFFKAEGVELGEHLKQIELLGVPAYAIFVSTDVCGGLCDPITNLFVLASMQPSARAVTALSKKIAANNYTSFCANSYNAHHTWVEIDVGDTTYALDFTDQVAMPKELYYKVYQYNTNSIYKMNPVEIVADKGCIDDSYVALASRLAYLASPSKFLLDDYCNLFASSVYGQDFSEIKSFMKAKAEQLQQQGLTEKYPSQSFYLKKCAGAYDKTKELVAADEPIAKVVNTTLADMLTGSSWRGIIRQGNQALKQVFATTNQMHKYIADLNKKGMAIDGNYQLNFDDLLGKN